MPNAQMKVINLSGNAHIVFTRMKEYLESCGDRDTFIDIKQITNLVRGQFEKTQRRFDEQSARNITCMLEKKGLIERNFRKAHQGKAEGIFKIKWDAVENSDIIKKVKKVPQSPSIIANPPRPESNEKKKSEKLPPTQPKIKCLRIQTIRPGTFRMETSDEFEILIEKSCKLGLEDFRGSVPDSLLRNMFFKGSTLEAILDETTVSIIAHDAMDCKLNGHEMETGVPYVIKPDIPYDLLINTSNFVLTVIAR